MVWLIAGYMWLYIHRPFEFWTWLGDYRIERVYMICLLAIWAVYPRKTWVLNRLQAACIFFTLAIFACWSASPFERGQGEYVWEYHWKVCCLFVLMVTVVQDEKQLRQLLLAFFLILTVYQLHSFFEFLNGRYEYRMGTMRMKAIDKTHGDPNTFAATLLHAMPFLLPFWFDERYRSKRPLMVGYMLLSLMCLLLTGSRRAFLGLGFFVFLLAWRSQRRWTWMLVMMFLAPIGFAALPDNLQNRFLTLVDSSKGPENAHGSAAYRMVVFADAWRLLSQYPLLGTGPGSFTFTAGHSLKAHNLYAQVMSEMGLVGIFCLSFTVWCFWKNSREATRLYQEHGWEPDFAYHVARNGWLAVVLLLFMGFGGHNLFRYNWLWFGAFQLVAVHVARCRARQSLAYHWQPRLVPRVA